MPGKENAKYVETDRQTGKSACQPLIHLLKFHRDDPHKALQLFSKAAESLSWFDVTDHTIRTSGDWGLLPLQANPN
jgi:hypothetical protein